MWAELKASREKNVFLNFMEHWDILSMKHDILFAIKNSDSFQSFLFLWWNNMTTYEKIDLQRSYLHDHYFVVMWDGREQMIVFIKKVYVKPVIKNSNQNALQVVISHANSQADVQVTLQKHYFFHYCLVFCFCFLFLIESVVKPRGSCSHWKK